MTTLSDGRSAVIGHPSLLSCDWLRRRQPRDAPTTRRLARRVVGFAGERAPVREPGVHERTLLEGERAAFR